ncbi:helix-turn-helix domain-containing protein [Paracoccus liaowanqingii]|uniref:helix-turn-helix domain-containing protein n=1 Tax=Paracoccus liaowanqingii TaxID=2560053 RepID=UPI001F0F5C35|nr:AraC family transcriptional regulator [Paracoccus liaowanqingii]
MWIISGEAVVEERDPGRDWAASHVRTGDFFLTRSATLYEMRWRAIGEVPFQVMHLYLSVELFERVASDMLGCDAPPALRDVAGARDAQLSHLLALVHQELTAEGKGSELFIQSLAQCLAVHLIRHYAAAEVDRDQQTALPGFRLRQALSYLATHLAEPFSLAELASVVGMSKFHFSRLFKKATGMSPSRYLIRQRIGRAQTLLQETDLSIIQIGMSVGYTSPSHFAQAFRRETGVTPTCYRRG